MTTDLVIRIPGRKPFHIPVHADNAETVARALAQQLPVIVRHSGRVSAVIERDGISHLVVGITRTA